MSRLRSAAILAAATFGLSACVYDNYGYGHVNVGYGHAGYYDDYYDPYYGRPTYYGWYNGYYYPGTGYYVYDQYRRPYRWDSYQQQYWHGRARGYRGDRVEDWREFRREMREDRRDFRQDRRAIRRDFREGDITRDQFRDRRDPRR
jgi:hypothetical protein